MVSVEGRERCLVVVLTPVRIDRCCVEQSVVLELGQRVVADTVLVQKYAVVYLEVQLI